MTHTLVLDNRPAYTGTAREVAAAARQARAVVAAAGGDPERRVRVDAPDSTPPL